jgi:hypothetical protein
LFWQKRAPVRNSSPTQADQHAQHGQRPAKRRLRNALKLHSVIEFYDRRDRLRAESGVRFGHGKRL